jgi:hypothetical protein
VLLLGLGACAPQSYGNGDFFVDAGTDTRPRQDTLRLDTSAADSSAADTGVAPSDSAPEDRTDPGDGAPEDRTDPDGGTLPPEDSATMDTTAPPDGPMMCTDEDMDGISDLFEGAPILRTSLRPGAPPDYQNIDSDDDGIPDAAEARRFYPGFEAMARMPLTCGDTPDDCDRDGVWNHRDRDSDNDGLTDNEEYRRWRTNPCAADSDGDGVSDLIESVAMSNPTNPMSRPAAGTIYVTLPYMDPMGHQHRQFDFSTRIHSADIMFLVDTTGSMGGTISQVQSSLSTVIVPGVVRALGGASADIRYGMAAHGDFAEGGVNYTGNLTVFSALDSDPMRAQTATSRLRADSGGDGPESQVPAMHSLVAGYGVAAYGGTATRPVTPADCGGDATAFGWGCFRTGRVPILVLFSDAPWHNGPGGGNDYRSVPTAATYAQLSAEMVRRQVYFVGIDVGGGSTFANSQALARATGTLDGSGNPIAFRGTPSSVAMSVISAITTLAQGTRQDVTRRVDPDAMERRLPTGRTTADFVKAVTPLRGMPPAPVGFARMDMTTFYSVAPSTIITFDVDLFNDFHRNGTGMVQLFQATIRVLGRASSVLDSHPVYIVVPSDANVLPM